ncbi:hypothetical protein Avbf_09191 [Armadillidium vulgare]|nr:hypothetical protein Avbf_09191 [Armadillidium vulgare]
MLFVHSLPKKIVVEQKKSNTKDRENYVFNIIYLGKFCIFLILRLNLNIPTYIYDMSVINTSFPHGCNCQLWTGRVALVTGASTGIGASICEVLVQSGLKVVGAARGVEKIQTLSETLKDAKGSLLPVKCDLTKEEDIHSTVEEMLELTNVNIIALCLCSQLAIASMRERGVDDGHVININSTSGHAMTPQTSSRFYASTKFASVSPGMVNTEFAYRAFKDPEKAKNLYSSIEPLRPEDVAASINEVIIRPTEQQH